MKTMAIDLIERLVERMKLINGPDTRCICTDISTCPNHVLIHEAEQFLKENQ